ncbi:uncharacterized protein LOC123298796 [Chrysoperla carnea]|uniref:uncharacterized protein LOC123298796 n=1 Tax=Chrysoperla carnea TaxID=189513 RepID=UPI001D06783C|nr:uncharacterized protein LOC123298796 [Chrysoperla carnea]
MTSWAARMHRRAATFSNVVTSCGHPSGPYPRRLEKVKFGVPLEEVCKNDIPGPLLVLILKLNKEAPVRKDVFRAPGHQGAMKKLIHFLQTGRLVNMDNFSVYTIASVLKKFLRKIPGGVFGHEVEMQLFQTVEMTDIVEQRKEINRLLTSLPLYTQRLLVLLFGTFRVIASNSERCSTGMSSEALGVSVAPSFFQSCVSDGKTARMEDVLRFKVATRIMKHLIDEFSAADLFGRHNYEWYARVTGRVLRVQGQWICSFNMPPELPHELFYSKHLALETEKTWLQCQCERWTMGYNLEALSQPDECQSMPTLMQTGPSQQTSSSTSLGIIPEHTLLESCTRLSVSLEENGLFKAGQSSRSSSQSSRNSHSGPRMTLDELRAVNRYAESTKSLTYLPQVHERQTKRMLTRSEWFLTPVAVECAGCGGSLELAHETLTGSDGSPLSATSNLLKRSSSGNIVAGVVLSASAESVQKRPSVRRTNSRDKRHYLHRSSSRRNKENGSRSSSFKTKTEALSRSNSHKADGLSRSNSNKGRCLCRSNSKKTATTPDSSNSVPMDVEGKNLNDRDLQMELQTIHVTLTYKPRI